MEKTGNNPKELDSVKDFLLADFEYFSSSFWKNEETGETRVKFLITLVAAVFTALGALISADELLICTNYIPYICGFALFGLLVVSVITLFRLIKRDRVTDEFKDAMDEVRKVFRKHSGDSGILDNYDPFRESRKDSFKGRRFGGLAHTVAAMNSLILSALVALPFYKYGVYCMLGNAVLAFALSLWGQVNFIRNRRKSS